MKRKINEAKRQTWNDFLNKMDYRTDGAKAYRLMNTLNDKKVQKISHPMKIKGNEVVEPRTIARMFNNYYLKQYTLSKNQKKQERKERKFQRIKYTKTEPIKTLFTKDFSMEELQKAIDDLREKKLPGTDNIFPEYLKHLGDLAKITLLSIYNNFWKQNLSLPTDWVKATVIPIPKEGKPRENIESYRPISLTSVMAKTFEKMLISRLKFFLEAHDIIVEEQARFRNNMSTSNTILKVVHKIKSGFNAKRSTLAVFVDFQGAYDTVWRSRLINKLKMYGIDGHMLSWIKRFLAQRWVKTRWNHAESRYGQSKVGLPQGAVSSCTLFNIYLNDLVKCLKKVENINVSMFADDVVIWTDAKNSQIWQNQRQQLQNTMNKALETLQIWADGNNMIVNKSKTVYQFFSLRHVNPDFELKIENNILYKSTNSRYLGVVLDKKLNFKEHVNKIKDKTEKRLPIMKRLAGAKWGCTQITLNKTYNTYVKPIIRYGSEVLITAAQDKLNILERTQNKAFRLIIGAVRTTPIAAMQLYTMNPPVYECIKRQAVSTYIRLKTSQRANWIHECQPLRCLKTQISPIEKCQEILNDIEANVSMDYTKKLVNPLEYTNIIYHLILENFKKKATPDMILITAALCMMDEKYPEPEWIRVYTDGSQINEAAGAGVYCKLFSQYAPVGKYMSNFDAEIHAIYLAINNLRFRIYNNCFSKVVILVDSRAAIQAVSTNHPSETPTITSIKLNLNFLRSNDKHIVFQWIPSHVGIDGNELADLLAKKGTHVHIDQRLVPPESFKKYAHRRIIDTCKTNLVTKSIGKTWSNIQESWELFNGRPRKEAVANFRLKTGHDCLAEHLNRIGVLPTSTCPICNLGIMNSEHLLKCSGLEKDAQRQGNVFKLYWDARALMD